MNQKNSVCFKIENISIFILTLLLFFYTLGIFIYSVINVIDASGDKIIVKNGLLFLKNSKKHIEYDTDSILLTDNIKVNVYEI